MDKDLCARGSPGETVRVRLCGHLLEGRGQSDKEPWVDRLAAPGRRRSTGDGS